MKKIVLVFVVLLLLAASVGCSSPFKSRKYREDFVYATDEFEPIDVGYGDHAVVSAELVGVPETGIKAAAWDSYDVRLRCEYDDGTVREVPLKVINIPIEARHVLGEVGEHRISLMENREMQKFSVKIVKNPDWDGYTCRYFDRHGKLLYSEKVGFYGTSTYKGKELPEEEEDGDYLYKFVDWTYDTEHIHQDMQFKANYDKLEKRLYAVQPDGTEYVPIIGKTDEAKQNGGALIYLGRVFGVAAAYGEAVELEKTDVVLEFPTERFDFPSFFLAYNRSIVENVVEYVNVPGYNQHIYGAARQILSLSDFGRAFAADYQYDKDRKVTLANGTKTTLSRLDPYDETLRLVVGCIRKNEETVTAEDHKPGFYRIAVVGAFDVYLDVSYRRIGVEQYEIGAHSKFIIAPVADTFAYTVQYSEDGEFGPCSEKKLSLSTDALYAGATALDWGDEEE